MKTIEDILEEFSKEPMTPLERIEAAKRLEIPDRVPLAVYGYSYNACRVTGITPKELMFDYEKAEKAIEAGFVYHGGWDGLLFAPTTIRSWADMHGPYMSVIPGVNAPDDRQWVIVSRCYFSDDDYDKMIERGIEWFFEFNKSILEKGGWDFEEKLEDYQEGVPKEINRFYQKWEVERKIPVLGPFVGFPYAAIAVFRIMHELLKDIYLRKEKLVKILEILSEPTLAIYLIMARNSGVPRFCIADTWGGIVSPKHWKEICWPHVKYHVETLVDSGYDVIIDATNGGFDRSQLELFGELPKGRVILSLCGDDIFEAKEIIGDRICLMGNIRPEMLSFGTPEEIEEQCKKVIKICGKNGGFILSPADIPYEAKPENFQAMIKAVKTYGVY